MRPVIALLLHSTSSSARELEWRIRGLHRNSPTHQLTNSPASAALNPSCGLFDLAPDPQQISAPDLADLLFRVAAAHEFEGHVESLRGAVPTGDAAPAIEV